MGLGLVGRRFSGAGKAGCRAFSSSPAAWEAEDRQVVWTTKQPIDQFQRLKIRSNIPVTLQGSSPDVIPEPMDDRAEALVRLSADAGTAESVVGDMQLGLEEGDQGLTLTALHTNPSCPGKASIHMWLPFSCGRRCRRHCLPEKPVDTPPQPSNPQIHLDLGCTPSPQMSSVQPKSFPDRIRRPMSTW